MDTRVNIESTEVKLHKFECIDRSGSDGGNTAICSSEVFKHTNKIA